MKNKPSPKPSPWNPTQLLRDYKQTILRPKEDQRQGFAKVVAGGRVTGIDAEKPYLERMVTGVSLVQEQSSVQCPAKSREQAVLESVSSNLEAGIQLIDHREHFVVHDSEECGLIILFRLFFLLFLLLFLPVSFFLFLRDFFLQSTYFKKLCILCFQPLHLKCNVDG